MRFQNKQSKEFRIRTNLPQFYEDKFGNVDEMLNFLRKLKSPKLVLQNTENINRPVTIEGIKLLKGYHPPTPDRSNRRISLRFQGKGMCSAIETSL